MARKFIELKAGCMAKAFPDEPTFVLLGRDACAPLAIRAWIDARIISGKNKRGDPQISEAFELVRMMEHEQEDWSDMAHGKKVEMEGIEDLAIVDDRNKNPDYAAWKGI
jgi:hypothetical protein